MPDGQYSFYLHSDDRTDIAAMATISTISQPLRGDFIRTAATAGAVMYQTDARLPALIPVFFDGQLSAIRLCAVMALVSGTWSSLSGLPDEPDGGVAALAMSPETEYQRRRYTLTLQDDRSSERVERVLTGVSSRLRGELQVRCARFRQRERSVLVHQPPHPRQGHGPHPPRARHPSEPEVHSVREEGGVTWT